jgi:hypothetical protein
MQGYIARVTSKQGAVTCTEALVNGNVTTYFGDATELTGFSPVCGL